MTAVIAERVSGRSLVPDHLFARLIARIVVDEQIARPLAERIMAQALAFVKTCADNPGVPLSPSRLVDIGWHTFILHTREYAAFCQRVAGRFIHHTPTEGGPYDVAGPDAVLRSTINAIEASGFAVDPQLWEPHTSLGKCSDDGGGKCHQCYAGCYNSP
ncbi:MAG: glycine-rich domain-containing protein [Egibacteraceae bacterium]